MQVQARSLLLLRLIASTNDRKTGYKSICFLAGLILEINKLLFLDNFGLGTEINQVNLELLRVKEQNKTALIYVTFKDWKRKQKQNNSPYTTLLTNN
jgi:hypothetical protein